MLMLYEPTEDSSGSELMGEGSPPEEQDNQDFEACIIILISPVAIMGLPLYCTEYFTQLHAYSYRYVVVVIIL